MAPVRPRVAFDELARLDDSAWAQLIRAVDPQVFLLAMAGASETFVARMMESLGCRRANELLLLAVRYQRTLRSVSTSGAAGYSSP